jgi:hypothetical protein
MAPAAPFVYTEADAFWYLHLTQHQQEQYDAFYARLLAANELVPDVDDKYSLLRFLKARLWDVEKAHHMYIKMAEWRKAHKVAHIYEAFTFPELDTVAPVYPHFYQ